MNQEVKVIVGPTCSGKTERSIIEALEGGNGVIINCDSLQTYSDLKILTSFPSDEDRAKVPHKLFGYLKYNEDITVVDWAKRAEREIKIALENGKNPIVVGGTGMYVNVLINGISQIPEVSKETREKVRAMDFDEIVETLYNFDPDLAILFPKEKHHQLIRAYEIYLETGKSIRYFRSLPKLSFRDDDLNFKVEYIEVPREDLYRRIELRFDRMLHAGAIEEVSSLLRKINSTDGLDSVFAKYAIFKAIGAKEIANYLYGKISFKDMRELSIRNSRRYAKRQITWFRHQINV